MSIKIMHNSSEEKIIDTKKKLSDPISRAKQTLSVKKDEKNNFYASFTLTEGKGTSAQPIPFDDVPAFISALKHYKENGIPIRKENANMTALEFLHASIEEVDGFVEFRTYGGRGAKPTRFPKERFDDVISFMSENVTSLVEDFLKQEEQSEEDSEMSSENEERP